MLAISFISPQQIHPFRLQEQAIYEIDGLVHLEMLKENVHHTIWDSAI